jgi:hypothetical protein
MPARDLYETQQYVDCTLAFLQMPIGLASKKAYLSYWYNEIGSNYLL